MSNDKRIEDDAKASAIDGEKISSASSLNPCSECGSQPHIERDILRVGMFSRYYIRCLDTRCRIGKPRPLFEDVSLAVEDWNNRNPIKKEDKQ